MDTEGMVNGTSLTITIDSQPHEIKVPENVTLWLNSGSSISFSTNETTTQGFQRFLFVDWMNNTGAPVSSPQTILKPETFTATYKKLSLSPCIIATVTFGSELSPEVQFLRNFRDRLVLSTRAGSAFMNVFNTWYYSFSPQVADYIASHDSLRGPMRLGLYPLMSILALAATAYSAVAFSPELAIVVAGIAASTLIGLTYLTPMALMVRRVTKRQPRARHVAKAASIPYLVIVPAMIFGELAGSFWILAFSSSALVLVTVVSTALLASHLLAIWWHRMQLEAKLKNASCRLLQRTSRVGNSSD